MTETVEKLEQLILLLQQQIEELKKGKPEPELNPNEFRVMDSSEITMISSNSKLAKVILSTDKRFTTRFDFEANEQSKEPKLEYPVKSMYPLEYLQDALILAKKLKMDYATFHVGNDMPLLFEGKKIKTDRDGKEYTEFLKIWIAPRIESD